MYPDPQVVDRSTTIFGVFGLNLQVETTTMSSADESENNGDS
jgi:hypothetical protein